uniref:F-box domain-containing protein n=1 Tax=Caenorhabditis tropicalis TaxID=1561998 RepID=A0A1I7TTS8_9PELO
MSSFPLLELPFVAFKNVIYQMDPVDVLIQTQHSKFFKSIITAHKCLRVPCLSFSLTVSKDRTTIELYFDREFPDEKKLKDYGQDDPNRFEFIFYGRWRSNAEDYTKKFLEVLKPKGISLHFMDVDLADYCNHFMFYYVEKFSEIRLNQTKASEKELKFFVENIKTEVLYCSMSTVFLESVPLDLKAETVRIDNPSFLDFQSILNMKCKRMSLEDPCKNLKISDFVTLIRNWMEMGNLKDLEMFEMRIHGQVDEEPYLDSDELRKTVFQEAMEMKGAAKETSSKYLLALRRTDGKLATISIRSYFQFIVVQDSGPFFDPSIFRNSIFN